MATRDSYPAGTPNWVDVSVDDVAAASAFYQALFGWDPVPTEVDGEVIYTNFHLDGATVAGLGSKMGPPMPDAWTVYVATDDVGATLEAATAAGGRVVAGPMDVPDGKGTFGLFVDPNGAFCGLWKAGSHIGAERVNEPGTFVWNELATTDAPSSVEFYSAVFGWGDSSGNGTGAVFTDPDGREICGAHAAGDGEPPFWSVWFAVDDCDATVARVQELGGSVLVEPNDMGFGRGAVVAAPGGAVFGVGAMDHNAG